MQLNQAQSLYYAITQDIVRVTMPKMGKQEHHTKCGPGRKHKQRGDKHPLRAERLTTLEVMQACRPTIYVGVQPYRNHPSASAFRQERLRAAAARLNKMAQSLGL